MFWLVTLQLCENVRSTIFYQFCNYAFHSCMWITENAISNLIGSNFGGKEQRLVWGLHGNLSLHYQKPFILWLLPIPHYPLSYFAIAAVVKTLCLPHCSFAVTVSCPIMCKLCKSLVSVFESKIKERFERRIEVNRRRALI